MNLILGGNLRELFTALREGSNWWNAIDIKQKDRKCQKCYSILENPVILSTKVFSLIQYMELFHLDRLLSSRALVRCSDYYQRVKVGFSFTSSSSE